MSTLAQHKRHLAALHDIRDIMGALRNISLTEGLRLRRFLETQQRVIDGIERALRDFLAYYPQPRTEAGEFEILLLVGSERGFCGDFNEAVLAHYPASGEPACAVVAVGEKLGTKLEEARLPAETVAGPTTVEDVPDALLAVVDRLHALNLRHDAARLTIVHHQYDGHDITLRRRQPFRDFGGESAGRGYAPLLDLPPQEFYAGLIDHYLFAVLHGIFYGSLAAEHQLRLRHLQGALEQIDRQSAVLTRRYNSLRQELITEEIELILLSSGPRLS
jgi:F-type H+-transporting ATPase subunit gamma